MSFSRTTGKSSDHERGAALDGEDGEQSGWSAQGRVRWVTEATRGQPSPVLLRCGVWTVLWLQPAWRETLSGGDLALVAPGHDGGAKAHYDGIVAFSQTDFTEDLKKITVPVLVLHGDDDQIVPYADAGPLSAKLLRNSTLKIYKGFPHGMPTTEADTINADLLAFLKGVFKAAA
jgi:pimeloyl-ACP methyl ester carboxylesterase